jgi:hypothetical protein
MWKISNTWKRQQQIKIAFKKKLEKINFGESLLPVRSESLSSRQISKNLKFKI